MCLGFKSRLHTIANPLLRDAHMVSLVFTALHQNNISQYPGPHTFHCLWSSLYSPNPLGVINCEKTQRGISVPLGLARVWAGLNYL